ncbi:hypothetical protein [Paraburkholderia hospita]|nr:hypothetical protein [Paraburkholderia hospita]
MPTSARGKTHNSKAKVARARKLIPLALCVFAIVVFGMTESGLAVAMLH